MLVSLEKQKFIYCYSFTFCIFFFFSKEQVRSMLEKKLQTSLSSLTAEKDAEIKHLQDRINSLQQQIENVVQQHEEILLRAESDKQQALLLGNNDSKNCAILI